MANLNTNGDIGKLISLLLIEMVAFLGNTVMIVSGMRRPELRKFSNGFIFNMAVADVLQSMVVMPFALASLIYGKWHFSSLTCTAASVIKVTITMASVQSLAGISIDRYLYIVKSKSAINSRMRIAISVSSVWIVSILLSISPLFGWGELGFHPGKEVCTVLFYKTISHTVVVFTVGLFLPVSAMAICYYKIFKVLRSQGLKITKSSKIRDILSRNIKVVGQNEEESNECSRCSNTMEFEGDKGCKVDRKRGSCEKEATLRVNTKIDNDAKGQKVRNEINFPRETKNNLIIKRLEEGEDSVKRTEKQRFTVKEIQLLRSVILVMVVFISCWLPYVIFNMLRTLDIVEENPQIDTITMWLGFANSAVNPVLYGLTNRQFRNAAKKTLKSSCRRD